MRFLRHYVFHNFGLKLISLLAAMVLWALMATEPELETSIAVPVEFHNVPKDLELLSDQDNTVHLQVKGPSRKLRSMTRADVAVVLDLLPVQQPGTRTFPLDSSHVILPRGVTLVKSIPSQLRLVFEKKSTRAVPVVPRFTGTYERGYEIAHYTVEPPYLAVAGPESRVSLLDHAITDPINVSGLTGTAGFATNAYLPDPHLRFENLQSVRVTVQMKKK
jgi:YbbR domain-containing protein